MASTRTICSPLLSCCLYLDRFDGMNIYWIPRHYIEEFCRKQGQVISGRILDFGCGSRPYAACFPDVHDYMGVEYDRNLQPGSFYEKDKVYFYDGLKLPFPDNYFDAIVSFQVIEHIENLHDSLCELKRVSRPGAKLLITGPLLWPEHEAPFDFRRFTRWGVEQIFNGAGLEVVEARPMGSIYDVLCVFLLDHLNTHRLILARKFCRFICPVINMISVLLNKLDPWALRDDRYCYLDLGLIATNLKQE
ncbi:class I SAM-dependent methyltransferase [Cyanobium sp. Maggiore-St4-Cus]|uniref:class I SAM-dependent methyltransferase n=1 Tax=Cyanobium sp. Maggiore-St4-Cus TaxID=2823717 RepID=UPI0020CF97C7|nr:class I SAM-dependent methyltransferase [Cyanobium sp. Maggiore-St4-Cus]MCP9787678.1 class I SAM-dependent methyltransferase [Cyanobium sp. Maggiore-St4-Cus]